jgi:hypothetical protein
VVRTLQKDFRRERQGGGPEAHATSAKRRMAAN